MAVNDWNAQHAAAEGIVLLPVKWETRARPQSGTRPQEDRYSNALVGSFSTVPPPANAIAEFDRPASR